VKSIISVDVDDSQFKRFQELFSKYTAQLAQSPVIWKAVNKEQATLAANAQKMTAALLSQSQIYRENADQNRRIATQAATSERLWSNMSKTTKSVASNIAHATFELGKWTSILGAVGGLLGAGGLFGIDRLAERVTNQRNSALGLGLSIGQQKAFGVNFGGTLDTDSFLSWVNQMELDITKQGPSFRLLGHGTTGDTAKDTIELIDSIRNLARSVRDPRLLQPVLAGRGLAGIIAPEEARRLRDMSDAEYQQRRRGFARDSGALNINDTTASTWASFNRQLDRAGSEIFRVFVNGLTPLIPSLEKISAGFTKFIGVLLGSDLVKDGIDNLAKWLNDFAGKISKPEFLNKVSQFTSDIGGLADAIHVVTHPISSTVNPIDKALANTFGRIPFHNFISDLESSLNLPKGVLNLINQKEASGKLYVPDSSGGAIGPMQIKPATGAAFGYTADQLRDPETNVRAGAQVFAAELKRFHGDVLKALAGYHLGDTTLDPILKAHPKDWQDFLPDKYLSNVGRQGGMYIIVQNNTGGSAGVSVSQLGFGLPLGAVPP
jgi:Transglycosylase SLT domain